MKYLFLIALFGLMLGCSTTGPTQYNSTEDKWADGKKKSLEGEKIVNSAESDLEKGRKLVREGEDLVTNGSERVTRARDEYQTMARKMGNSSKPDQVTFESQQLKRVAQRWEDAIDDIKKGNTMVKKGNKTIADSQTKIVKGRTLMDTGSQLMMESQIPQSAL